VSKSSERVKRWRENIKIKAVDLFGGKCKNCSYNFCFDALDFHHKNPKSKEFHFGRIIANPIAWKKLIIELKKCILICANCHAEIHDGLLQYKKGQFKKLKKRPLEIKYRNATKTKIRRRINKEMAIAAFGGKCGICNYSKSKAALQFHHLIKHKKEYAISNISSHSWKKIELELKKCILICACCHREIHSGKKVPKFTPRYNKSKINQDKIFKNYQTNCVVCQKTTTCDKLTCSKSCASSKTYKFDWSKINIVDLIRLHKSISKAADSLGLTPTSLTKRLKKNKNSYLKWLQGWVTLPHIPH
jgi:5-methylcytosine-specific restriction endonuclease McrA